MMRYPSVYAQLLADRIKNHLAECWLINTGWTGGPFGLGSRMEIRYTRTLLNAALTGSLGKVTMRIDPIFGFQVPSEAPGIPSEILNPRNTWPNPSDYDIQAKKLAILFHNNFEQFKDKSSKNILAAAPRIG